MFREGGLRLVPSLQGERGKQLIAQVRGSGLGRDPPLFFVREESESGLDHILKVKPTSCQWGC